MNGTALKRPSAVANALIAGALLLPLLGLGYSWASTHSAAQKGTDWNIPVRGYDPRDLLRGHYIEYQYDWPGIDDGNELGEEAEYQPFDALCIKGRAPNIDSVTKLRGRNVSGASCDSLVRVDLWSEEYDTSMTSGRLFIPQTKGNELDAKLRDPKLQGVVRARIREDGKLTPQSISFRANPNPEAVQREDGIPGNLEVLDVDGISSVNQPPAPTPQP